MQGDMPDGSFSAEELERLEREGIIERIQPGTPEAEAFNREMAARLMAVDAELLRTDGPDALTSDRLLRQEALKAEHDPERVASAFAAWCRSRGWERADLASWLGVTTGQLAAMALHSRSDAGLADRYGADAGRLASVLS